MKKLLDRINVTKSFLPPFEEYVEEIRKIWNSNWLTNNGPLHNDLERKISDYLHVEDCVLFVNGHMALDVAIKALQLTGEVITTPFTFASTTHAIVMNNLTPVFCDINLDDYTMDADQIEALITDKTSAIIPVHVYGNSCNIEKINAIAKKYNLKVIYDAAHAFGVKVNGVGIGNFGDVSMFSLHATKVFNSVEGGTLAFHNAEYRRKFNLYKNFGITGPETVEAVGLNAKMSEFHAAMGIVNLRYLDEQMQLRKLVIERYKENLAGIRGLIMVRSKKEVTSNYSYLPVLIDENLFELTRDELYDIMCEHNVYPRKYFYPLITDYDCYKGQFDSSKTPKAKYAAQRIMTLPLYGSLPLNTVDDICEIILSAQKINGSGAV